MNMTKKMMNIVILMALLSHSTSLLDFNNKDDEEAPKFDDYVPDSYTVQQGDTAYLGCRIINHRNM